MPTNVPVSPLDAWLARRLDAAPTASGPSDDLPRALADYQARMLRRTLEWAMRAGPFHRERLAGLEPHVIRRPEDLAVLPRTTARDIAEQGEAMLCLSRGDIARVVTLRSSGTTGPSKRIHFTQSDLEHTVDFFHHGMTTFTGPGDRVLILLPGERPDSVGRLLARGVERLGARAVPVGLPGSPGVTHGQALDALLESGATCVVGFPVHVLALAKAGLRARAATHAVHSVLLCSDHVPGSLARTLEETWECTVLAHWGMTESGLGGGVECQARCGYHLREADLYVEVTDPDSGRLLPPGKTGEVVLTTLTRNGMPLIRYRTGDLAAMLAGPCPCGSPLRRLGPVCGRLGEAVRLGGNKTMTMAELDEALFAVPGMLDFSAEFRGGNGEAFLDVRYWATSTGPRIAARVSRVLETLLATKTADGSRLGLAVSPADGPTTRPGAKRTLVDRRTKERPCANS